MGIITAGSCLLFCAFFAFVSYAKRAQRPMLVPVLPTGADGTDDENWCPVDNMFEAIPPPTALGWGGSSSTGGSRRDLEGVVTPPAFNVRDRSFSTGDRGALVAAAAAAAAAENRNDHQNGVTQVIITERSLSCIF